MTQTATPNQLATIIKGGNLAEKFGNEIIEAFSPIFADVEPVIAEAAGVNVTDATQVTAIKAARQLRLTLKEIRVRADKVRKGLKEDSLRRTQAIDLVGRELEKWIAPVEDRLLEQEQFAERAEAARLDARAVERAALLLPYSAEPIMGIREMPEPAFAALLSGLKAGHEAHIAAEEKAKAEREEAERKRVEEEARIRAENERLRREAVEREKAAKAAADAARKEREEAEAKARAERAAAEAKLVAEREAAEKARKEAEAKARKEREAREAAEAKAKAEREAREREAREAEKARADAERAAALAPDRDKVLALIDAFGAIPMPTVESQAAKDAVAHVCKMRAALADRIRTLAEGIK